MQTKFESFVESNANTFIGFILSVLVWEFIVKPVWSLPTAFFDNLMITGIFTVISIARGYFVRRFFNWLHYGQQKPTSAAKRAGQMPLLVGMTGKAGAGKDTFAHFVGYPTDALAATLKAMLAAAGLPEPATRAEKEVMIPGLNFSWRQAAQTLGTEWGRSLNPNLWLLLLERRLRASPHEVVCITDVRFENEAKFVRDFGVLCHVEGRATTVEGQAAAHASEAGVKKDLADFRVSNRGTIGALRRQAAGLRGYIAGKVPE